jgi:hypothetical protein
MENIEPWCISRQLWWGHQIPAWYGPDDHIFVAEDEEVALDMAVQHYLSHEGPWKAWVEEKMNDFKPGDILTARPGRSRYLVLLGAVAVLHARLARRDARAQALLPDRCPGDGFRHHLLLGRPHDDDGSALYEG